GHLAAGDAEPDRRGPRAHRGRGQRGGRRMTDKTLRAGLIGLGAMGRNHARVLNSLGGVELVGAADPSPNAVAPHGVPVVPDLEALLKLGVDYVVVASPTGLHEEL